MTTGRINQISTVEPSQTTAFPPTRVLGSAYLGLGFRHVLRRESCPRLSLSLHVSPSLSGLGLNRFTTTTLDLVAEKGIREISFDNSVTTDQKKPSDLRHNVPLPSELHASVKGTLP